MFAENEVQCDEDFLEDFWTMKVRHTVQERLAHRVSGGLLQRLMLFDLIYQAQQPPDLQNPPIKLLHFIFSIFNFSGGAFGFQISKHQLFAFNLF